MLRPVILRESMMWIIQLQASTSEMISAITQPVRKAVSEVCLGVDDMHLLGNKALVVRAEIRPSNIVLL